MAIDVVLDTNVFINVKNREEPQYPFSRRILDWVDEGALRGIVSTIVIAEMCSGYYESDQVKEKDDFLTHLRGSKTYKIADLTASIADEAGRIRGEKGLRLPDSIIVATGLKEGAKYLATNDESFRNVKDLIRALNPRELVKELEVSVRRRRRE